MVFGTCCKQPGDNSAAHKQEWKTVSGLGGKRQLNHLGGNARARFDQCAWHCQNCTYITQADWTKAGRDGSAGQVAHLLGVLQQLAASFHRTIQAQSHHPLGQPIPAFHARNDFLAHITALGKADSIG